MARRFFAGVDIMKSLALQRNFRLYFHCLDLQMAVLELLKITLNQTWIMCSNRVSHCGVTCC